MIPSTGAPGSLAPGGASPPQSGGPRGPRRCGRATLPGRRVAGSGYVADRLRN